MLVFNTQVRAITIAEDSQRAIIGCDDTRALIFDMHSGRLIRSLPPNPGSVTALYVVKNDDFLITAGKFYTLIDRTSRSVVFQQVETKLHSIPFGMKSHHHILSITQKESQCVNYRCR